MKGKLVIDFEVSQTGRSVSVAGTMNTPRGPVDVTQDTIFSLGLLEYAKQALWDRERKQLEPTGAIEVPVGIDAEALRAR